MKNRNVILLVAPRLSAAVRLTMLAGSVVLLGACTSAPPAQHGGTLRDLSGRRVEVSKQAAPAVSPQQAADAYRQFLELQKADPQLRVEAMRRVGDLNIEANESRLANTADGTLDSKELQESIALYEKLLKSHSDYPNADAVLYQLSRAYEASGQQNKALGSLEQLVTRFPNSKWYTEGQFRRGELLFSQRRYADASRAYAAVVQQGQLSGFYDQGLYKQGWSLFKQARIDDSVNSFLLLLDRVLVKQGKVREHNQLAHAERELADDTLNVLAIMAADEDGPASIAKMVRGHRDPPYSHMLYAGLGDLYLGKERYQDAAQAFTAFSAYRPDATEAPVLEARAIEAYQKGGFAAKVLEAKQAFVERYAFDAPFWKTRQRTDAPQVVAQINSNLLDLAHYFHGQAAKSKKADDYTAAAKWYRRWLDSFPDDAGAAGNRYLLAELLFESGRFAEATQEYERTAYGYPQHQKSAAAGYAALVAYQKHEPTLSGETRAQWHRKFIDSSVMFATSFPTDPQAAPVLTKADEELFALNDYVRVLEVSQQLLDRPQTVKVPLDAKQRRTGATLKAHSLYELQRYSEAEAAYLQVRSLLPGNDADLPAIDERIAASIYKQAEAKQSAGNSNGAVDDFLRVAVLAPNSKISANAEYDAAATLIASNNWPRAIGILEQFRRAHPGHELLSDVNKKLAVGYQETGRGMDAALEYEQIAARKDEQPEVRRAALAQAAELYLQASQKGINGAAMRAAGAYANYVAQYPQPFDAAIEARQHLVELAKANGDTRAQFAWLQEIITADRNAGSARTDRSKFLAAHATLVVAQPVVAKFNAIKLTLPLTKSIKVKRQAMEEVLAVYGQALDYKVADVTTEATFGMAELYRQMGKDVMGSDRPKDLDADALEQYNVLLEEQAFPFEEKAITLHQSNIQRAADGLYDRWVKQSYAALAELNPGRYAKAELSEDYVSRL